MKRLYHFSLRTARRLLILSILLVALLVITGRLLAPLAAQYRADVATWASELLGQPVEVGRLQGSWRGLGPVLILYDLQLINPENQQPTLYLDEVRVSFGLLDSLRQLYPAVRKVSFIAPELRVTRRPNGAITIGSLDELNELAPGDGSSAFLLPTHLSLEQGKVIWEDQMVNVAPLSLVDVNLDLRNSGTRHQLNGSVTLPGERPGQITLAIDLQGQLDRIDSWSARSYTRSSGIDLAFLLNRRVAQQYRFSNREAEMELWGEWDHNGLISMEGTTRWEQLAITRQASTAGQSSSTLELDNASGAVRLQRLDSGWRLDLANLQIERNGRKWPESRLGAIAQQDDQGRWRIRAGSSRLRVEDIHAISTLFPLPDHGIKQMLERVEANGSLNNLRLDFQQQPEGDHWSARGEVTEFSSRPWQGVPGVNNLDLAFWMDTQQGTVTLNAANVTVDFADLFRDPLQLKRLQGNLNWQLNPDGDLIITTDKLLAENDDIHTLNRMRLTLPDDDQASPFLDLQSDFWNGDASTTHRYLPAGIMGDSVVAWVDRSIGSGRVTEGSALVRGPLADFPFEQTSSGRFEVFFNAEDLQLDYWPEWPPLKNLNAQVRFLNNSFDAWASSGQILDSQLTTTHARIDHLAHTSPLKLTGTVAGPLNDHLRLLTESPLKQDFAALVKDLKGEGSSQLELAFSLPIDDGSDFQLDGRLSFLDSTLRLEQWQLDLSEIRGDLQFDQDHIFASGISGKVLNQPIRVDVTTPENSRNSTRISATGKIPVSTLQKQLPALDLAAFASGSSQWQLDVDIPHFAAGPNAPVPVRARTDLVGIRIDQPMPLGKTAEAVRPLLLETRIDHKPLQQLHIRYDNRIDMALAIDRRRADQPQLERGSIVLGGERASLPDRAGLELSGRLETLQLSPWLERLGSAGSTSQLPPINRLALEIGKLEIATQQTGPVRLSLQRGDSHWEGDIVSDWAEGAILLPLDWSHSSTLTGKLKRLQLDPWLSLLESQTGTDESQATLPQRLMLTVDQLQYKKAKITDFSLELNQDSQAWQADFNSSHFSGDARVPLDPLQAPITLTLDYLNLDMDEALFDRPEQPLEKAQEQLNPERIPTIRVQVDKFNINQKPFGTLQLITRRVDNGLSLESLAIDSERLQLNLTGDWLLTHPPASTSRINLTLTSPDLGGVFQDIRLSDNLDDAPVQINSHINWPGSPFDFSTRLISGELSMQIGKGRFLQVDPGVGRLFGLFNLGALKRRLSFDFSDIFKKGFTFDSIDGNFLLDTGDAFTNDFRMLGPSADIELSGRIGLGDEDVDALVIITPKISSSIPLAGAIAGGPAVGAALFLAQQLMGDSIDRATRLEYMATGSWDDPLLTPQSRDNREENKPAAEEATPDRSTAGSTQAGSATVGPAPATPSDTTPAEATAPDQTGTEAPSEKPPGFFSRLLKKIKPSAPTYQENAPGAQ
ncbi:YhdP family protein [Sedimenticola thiotaurini]|uniref:YhdP central domain-containing protein n=1 Tax=Sedimenticola thiotaurini TaxID=1543721 RepID=A0A0F7K1W4_9GAMM|nr:YhdP family protein [Sedimenticola thiotaurini]AKH20928.1 hypothetical protein AAY24_11875 [Sedimenticola thiotaurini]